MRTQSYHRLADMLHLSTRVHDAQYMLLPCVPWWKGWQELQLDPECPWELAALLKPPIIIICEGCGCGGCGEGGAGMGVGVGGGGAGVLDIFVRLKAVVCAGPLPPKACALMYI